MPGDPAVPEVEERGPDARSEEEVSSGETEPSEDVSSEEDTVSGEDASAPDDVSGVEDAAIEPARECTESTPCNDLDPCTEDLCDDGVCVHTPIAECCTTDGQCDDGVACTLDSCNTFTNTCSNNPEDNFCCLTSADCDDFDACSFDACVNNQCLFVQQDEEGCSCAADALCDDNNPCTVDTCEASSCVYTPTAGDGCCPDGSCGGGLCQFNQCWDGPEACSEAADCEAPSPCWAGSCGEEGCTYEEKEGCCVTASDCDDGQEATTDLCIAGSCVFAVGETTPCVADGECAGINSCTTGLCTEAGVCSIALTGAEGCCESASDCPVPADSCTGATCADFQCGEAPLEGFQALQTFTFDGDFEGWTEESNGAGAFWQLSSFRVRKGVQPCISVKQGCPTTMWGLQQEAFKVPKFPLLRSPRFALTELLMWNRSHPGTNSG